MLEAGSEAEATEKHYLQASCDAFLVYTSQDHLPRVTGGLGHSSQQIRKCSIDVPTGQFSGGPPWCVKLRAETDCNIKVQKEAIVGSPFFKKSLGSCCNSSLYVYLCICEHVCVHTCVYLCVCMRELKWTSMWRMEISLGCHST